MEQTKNNPESRMININDPIETIKAALKGLPKKEKVNALKQAIANVTLKGNPPMTAGYIDHRTKEQRELAAKLEKEKQVLEAKAIERTNKLIKELEDNPEAYQRPMKRKELKPFLCDRPLDWYANHIKAKRLFFDFLNEIEKHQFEKLTSEDFFNILYFQNEYIQENAHKPFEVANYLKALPLHENERVLLYNLMLKSFGEINEKNKYYIVLANLQNMLKDLKTVSNEAETIQLSDRYKIPMDNAFSSAEKALAHYYAHGQVSEKTALAIIKTNQYKQQRSNEALTPGGFIAAHSKITGLLKKYLATNEIETRELKYRNLLTTLNNVRGYFMTNDNHNAAEKIESDLHKLSLKPKKVVKKVVK